MPISHLSDISDLLCVIDSMFAYTDAGSTLASNNGDIVQQATDQSGNGNHWTNTGSSTNRPTIVTGDEIGSRVLNFDSTVSGHQFFNVPAMFNALTGAVGASAVYVIRIPVGPPASDTRARINNFSTNDDDALQYTDGNWYTHFGASSGFGEVSGVSAHAQLWSVYMIRSKTNSLQPMLDRMSGVIGQTTSTTFGFRSSGLFWGKGNSGTNGWDGKLRLAAFYGHYLTDTEVDDLGAFVEDNFVNRPALQLLLPHTSEGTILSDAVLHGAGGEWATNVDTSSIISGGALVGNQLFPVGNR